MGDTGGRESREEFFVYTLIQIEFKTPLTASCQSLLGEDIPNICNGDIYAYMTYRNRSDMM